VEISVPAMEELRTRTVRVSGEGTIALPFLGVILASGLTEEKLRQELHRQLQEYMNHPQVNLFVREYRSRQVAVLGAVTKPGFYNLASGADTLLDVISLAGGTNGDAAPWICLNPSEENERGQPTRVASTSPVPQVGASASPGSAPNVEPLIIALEDVTSEGNREYLSLPARPGDVITVPTRGEVLIHGWVAKPGSYKITPGLTVLGAVMAAGGPVFAAELNAVKILRRENDGREASLPANLDKIRQGASPDIPVRSGDIVVVSASGLKVVPYGFYQFIASLVHVGASVPLF
jgi:polysaccharide biosynthesis/export protein